MSKLTRMALIWNAFFLLCIYRNDKAFVLKKFKLLMYTDVMRLFMEIRNQCYQE